MTINKSEYYIELIPSEGKVLYNGEVTSTDVFLPLNADPSVWVEIDADFPPKTNG